MIELDRRLHAFRPDLADARLRGLVGAASFAEGRPARVAAPVADLRAAPRFDAGLDTQLLAGDDVTVFDERNGWSWVQSVRDGYVGYAPSTAIAERGPVPTHVVRVPRSFAYGGPDLKSPQATALSIGSGIAVATEVETRGTRYAVLDDGRAVVAAHLRRAEEVTGDWVATAELLERTPYLWGGASAFGIDCSGLVQIAMRMAGRSVPRDTDMQVASIGDPVDVGPLLKGLCRGDLVFWKGHVAIMRDGETIVHASGHVMQVAIEPLAAAIERIGYLYGQPTAFRRP